MKLILVGAGSHAAVAMDTLRSLGAEVIGLVDPAWQEVGPMLGGARLLGDDDSVSAYSRSDVLLVNAIGSTRETVRRREVFERFKSLGYSFATIVHPSAVVSPSATLDEGSQVMAGCIVQAGSSLGANVLVNTAATIDHDCVIGRHVHIAPGCTLSGGVRVGPSSHIGTGAVIIENVEIGSDSLVAAGAVVTRDVASRSRVQGVPARKVKR